MSHKLTMIIVKPGLQTTIQDLGRSGWQEFGVPVSGAMDRRSLRLANLLVGNAVNNPCLEITLLGPEILFDGNGLIAITGANLSPAINDHPIPLHLPIKIYAGDRLSFGKYINGCRSYLAVHGHWLSPRWLNSYSVVPYCDGFPSLPPYIKKNHHISIEYLRLPEKEITIEKQSIAESIIEVIPGPEFHEFSQESRSQFGNETFEITNQSNRMGYRLKEKLTGPLVTRSLISSGVVPGTIQVTHSGQMIILMADAQTTGGYPRIGVVRSADLDILGQKKPGDTIRFKLIHWT
ncbi:MAG: biotin-dependent carboxyltransferase family protein [Saprospiraceae bacterium]|nr:biotin-dependent carboxyltransferase family protein [Saprospiraceae bacterium]